MATTLNIISPNHLRYLYYKDGLGFVNIGSSGAHHFGNYPEGCVNYEITTYIFIGFIN